MSENHLGIPKAPFSERSEELLIPGESPEGTLSKFEELLNKYRMMEISLNNKRIRMQAKLEDLNKSIASIDGLKANPTATFHFELNDTLHAKAHLPGGVKSLETVHLWLGANVMLSYPVEEGLALLREKKGEAEGMVERCEKDLLFLRDQITTMEVNTARVYNLLVQSVKANGVKGMLARESSPLMTSKMAALLHSPTPSVSSPLAASSNKNANQFQNEWNFVRHLAAIESEKEENVLHVMERLDSGTFAVFGEEAAIVASALFNSTTSLTNPFGPEAPAMLVLNQLGLLLQEFLLMRDGWRVEIWTWDAVRKAFKCSKRASPGNLEAVEEILVDTQNVNNDFSQDTMASSGSQAVSPVIAAVIVGSNEKNDTEIALSWCDLSSLRIGSLCFQDNSLLTTLESALIQLGVRELLVPHSSTDSLEKVKQITSASQIVLQPLKANEFFACDDSKGMEEDLARLVGEDRLRMSEMNGPLTRTMRCLFVYLNLLGVDSNVGAFRLVSHNLKDFARLDEAALTSLNIFPKLCAGANRENSNFSLFGFLDYCKTAAGSRTLNQWLRQPLTNCELIENRLDLVELFVECPEGRHRLRENVLRGIPDIAKLLKKLVRARSSLQEIVMLYQSVAKLHQIVMELESNEDFCNHLKFSVLESSLLTPLRQLTQQLSPFVQMIEDTIDFEALGRNEYCLRPDFDAELQEISREKGKVLDAMEPEFKRVCQTLKLEAGKKCKMERNNVYGYYFRVSRLDATKLSLLGGKNTRDSDSEDDNDNPCDNTAKAYTELATLKSGVLFTTAKLSQLARRYDALSEDYADKQSVLVSGLLVAAQPFRPVFNVLETLFSMLDVLLALAHVAGTSSRPFVRPQITKNGGMRLLGARHACVEVQPGVNFIPNDAVFDRSAGKILQFITGPNMGGKSTFIRQTALIAIMAQCGSFVPCDRAEMPVFDAILVRVGAGDNITRGISTFMAEMLETATILQTATKDSLVVIDELGRGTSTCDGISLSRAIAQYLAGKVGCFTFFATHFHELTALSCEHPESIANLHVAVKEDAITGEAVLLFKVKEGVCDRSYGIHVAKAVGFPEVVVKMAEWRADLLEGNRPAQLTAEEAEFIKKGNVLMVPISLQKYF